MCLNAAGLSQIRESGLVAQILRASLDVRSLPTVGSRRGLLWLGTQMEELVRHHPEVKTEVADVVASAVEALLATPHDSELAPPASVVAAPASTVGVWPVSEHVNRVAVVSPSRNAADMGVRACAWRPTWHEWLPHAAVAAFFSPSSFWRASCVGRRATP